MEYEYMVAIALHKADYGFYSLIMAAMLKADTTNVKLLKALYPQVWTELERLYN
jgi:hypothetical protein